MAPPLRRPPPRHDLGASPLDEDRVAQLRPQRRQLNRPAGRSRTSSSRSRRASLPEARGRGRVNYYIYNIGEGMAPHPASPLDVCPGGGPVKRGPKGERWTLAHSIASLPEMSPGGRGHSALCAAGESGDACNGHRTCVRGSGPLYLSGHRRIDGRSPLGAPPLCGRSPGDPAVGRRGILASPRGMERGSRRRLLLPSPERPKGPDGPSGMRPLLPQRGHPELPQRGPRIHHQAPTTTTVNHFGSSSLSSPKMVRDGPTADDQSPGESQEIKAASHCRPGGGPAEALAVKISGIFGSAHSRGRPACPDHRGSAKRVSASGKTLARGHHFRPVRAAGAERENLDVPLVNGRSFSQ